MSRCVRLDVNVPSVAQNGEELLLLAEKKLLNLCYVRHSCTLRSSCDYCHTDDYNQPSFADYEAETGEARPRTLCHSDKDSIQLGMHLRYMMQRRVADVMLSHSLLIRNQ